MEVSNRGMDCLCVGSSFMADLSSCRPSCYGRAQQQITTDRQQDSHDACLAKINLVQHDELINYVEDRRRDKALPMISKIQLILASAG